MAMKLTLDVTCVYDYVWEKLPDVSFAEKLRLMLGKMRYIRPPFEQVPNDMCEFNSWDEMCEEYEDHLPAFFCLLEYLVRQLFKFLFGDQASHVFAWYHRSKALNNPVTRTIVEHITKSSKTSAERRVLLSCFMRAHTASEICTILENYPDLLAEVKTKMKESASNSAGDTAQSSGTAHSGNEQTERMNGPEHAPSVRNEDSDRGRAGNLIHVSDHDSIARNLFPTDNESSELTRPNVLPVDSQARTGTGGQ